MRRTAFPFAWRDHPPEIRLRLCEWQAGPILHRKLGEGAFPQRARLQYQRLHAVGPRFLSQVCQAVVAVTPAQFTSAR